MRLVRIIVTNLGGVLPIFLGSVPIAMLAALGLAIAPVVLAAEAATPDAFPAGTDTPLIDTDRIAAAEPRTDGIDRTCLASGGVDPRGVVFDRYDPDRTVRDAIDPCLARSIFQSLESRTPSGSDPEQTVLHVAQLSAHLADEAVDTNRMSPGDRHDLDVFLLLSALQVAANRHADLASRIEAGQVMTAASPIEDYCKCDKSGSRACGCQVLSTGPGACEYHVACPTVWKSLCSAINAEACIVKVAASLVRANAEQAD